MPPLETPPTDENFEAAFDRLSQLGNAPPVAVEPPVDPNAPPAAAEGGGNEAVVEPGGDAAGGGVPLAGGADGAGGEPGVDGVVVEPPADPPAAAAPPVVAPPAEPPAGSADDDLLAKLAKAVKAVEAPASAAPAPAPEAPAPLYSVEEQQFLTDYEKDWPDVAKAEALRRRADLSQVVDFVFSEFAKEMRPIMEQVTALATRAHVSELQTNIPDYENLRDKVIDWVGAQPEYLQTAYNHVITQGTAEEVADLVGRYQAANPGAVIQPQAQPGRETDLPPAARQAAAALAPVSSKRSAVPQAEPATFDDAFERFAAARAAGG